MTRSQTPQERDRNAVLQRQAEERDLELLNDLVRRPDVSVSQRAREHGVSRQRMHDLIQRARRRVSAT